MISTVSEPPGTLDTLLAQALARPAPPPPPTNPWRIPVSDKQLELIRLCHPAPQRKRYILISGPRKSTKTIGCLHAIVDNLWHTKNANFSVISPTITAGSDGGCWWLLTKNVVPLWIQGGFGLKWVTEPRQNALKKLYFQITNKFGGVSTCQLDSLQYEKDAEAQFKNKNYSGIYVSELSYYKKRATYDNWIMALRGPDWGEDDLLFIGDTNPAEEGEESWIWKHWFQFRVQEDVTAEDRVTQERMALMEFTIPDNVFMSKREIDTTLAIYSHSEDLLKRYRDGLWVKSTENSIFFEQFRPNIHIVGGYETRENPEPDILLPEDNCWELITGWDMGTSNSAFGIMEKVMVPVSPTVSISIFKLLDEVLYLGETDVEDLSLIDFIKECYERILFWEHLLGKPINWRNWSDRSAMTVKDPIHNIFQYQLVLDLTDKRIHLQAADRSPGSVQRRVDFTKRLLFENRLYTCRSRCPNMIDSFQALKKGKAGSAVDKHSKYKHTFDAFSYAYVSECYDEVIRPRRDLNVGRASERLISVPL